MSLGLVTRWQVRPDAEGARTLVSHAARSSSPSAAAIAVPDSQRPVLTRRQVRGVRVQRNRKLGGVRISIPQLQQSLAGLAWRWGRRTKVEARRQGVVLSRPRWALDGGGREDR